MNSTATKSGKAGKGRKASTSSKRGGNRKALNPGARSKQGTGVERLRPGQLDGLVLGLQGCDTKPQQSN